jgi:outer membrane immunogenic protein
MKNSALAVLTLFATSMAGNAADLPRREAPIDAPAYTSPVFSWTGFYLGGNIGGAWASRTVKDTVNNLAFSTSSTTPSPGRFIGGGQVGFNYQFNSFVIGVEADFDWGGENHKTNTGILVPGVAGLVGVTSNDSWLTTVAARFGFATDCVWLYGKAGGGWVGNNGFTITNTTTGSSITSSSQSSNGWLVGGGVEWAFSNNWTAKVEYDYLALSDRSFVIPAGAPFLVGDTFNFSSRTIRMVKVGVNYLFNGGQLRTY